MVKYPILVFIVMVSFNLKIYGQKLGVKPELYTQNNGLSNSHIVCMTQDSKGFIWIGTDNGLNKFDGFDFVKYFNIPGDNMSLPDDAISALHVDRNGQLWIGTNFGLSRYDTKSGNFYTYPFLNEDSTVFQSPVRAIAEDEDGKLWIGTSGQGIKIFDPVKNVFAKLPPVIEKLSPHIKHIFTLEFDNFRKLWVGMEKDGLYAIDYIGGTFKHYNAQNSGLKSNAILTLTSYKESLWIGNRGGGLSVFNEKTNEIITIDNFPTNFGRKMSNDVYSIEIDKNGILWLGTNNHGLLLYDPLNKTFTNYPLYDFEERFRTKSLKSIFHDRDGNIWFGIHQLGIALIRNFKSPFFDNSYFSSFNKKIIKSSVLGILVDKSGDLWLGTDGTGLIRFSPDKMETSQFLYNPDNINSIPANVVRSVFEDKNQQLWIGTYKGGLSKLDKKTGIFRNYYRDQNLQYKLDYDDVSSFVEDKKGNLWIGTNGGGLYKYNEDNDSFDNFFPRDKKNKTTICSEWIVTLFTDSKGYIWIGTYWGLSRFDPVSEAFTNFWHDNNDSNSISHNHAFAINEDKNGNIWVGTKYGLNLFNSKTNTFKTFTEKNGLPSNVINAILTDDKNNIWLSTNNGICCFNTEMYSATNFYFADGLQNNEFIRNSAFKDKDGNLYFGGVDGFNTFHPDKIKTEEIFPKVVLTDFQIFNKSVQIGNIKGRKPVLNESISEAKEIFLEYYDNSFSFEFVAIDYIHPENIEYACKMEGFEEDWNVLNFKRRFITYTNLSPGTYIFKVKASNRKDVWGAEATEIIIHVRPPVWKTNWAYFAFALILILLVYFTVRILRERLRVIQQIKFEKHRNEQIEHINQAKLEFFTNVSHEFRTPLTLIIGPIDSLLESGNLSNQVKSVLILMHRNANRLLRLVNQLLDLRKVEEGNLKLQAREINLNEFINEIVQSFEDLARRKGISFEFDNNFPELKIWADVDKLDKIFFNLLSNAFKFTPDNGFIRIEVKVKGNPSLNEGFVNIEVSDNGNGMTEEHARKVFERFYQSDESVNSIQRGSGIGLSLTKSLVELHHGTISVKSRKGEGSCFTVLLPIGKKHLREDELVPKEFLESENLNLQPDYIDNYDDYSLSGSELLADPSAPLVLLVEDNDDLRQYIKSGLQSTYRIAEARNGIEGIEKAHELMPDLVICDVMMPEMDGIKFCRKLKSELLTCHIPVIMLTAKTSIEHRIEGLETGADSYIPKPFNPKHLKVRIQKLIELRQVLKNKYKVNGHFEPVEMAVTSTDEKFINKAVAIIKREISNSEFNVENLGQEIGMSRGHLHRKLKALIGQNPSDFIKTIRLKQAAHLLSNENIPVSEICYLVGFSSPSYFASCFHKQFGITPTEYKNRKE
ncbi:MAG: two-component regulator propeller domain-containing protein [Bacteroidales bacterium]